jgi:acyl carrier protein
LPETNLDRLAEEILEQTFRKALHLDAHADLSSVSRATSASSWSSLRHADLILSLEQKLGIRFSYNEIIVVDRFSTLRELVLDKLKK